MFDIGFWEIALIGVIALLVVGPERLPALARNVGLWVGRIRRYVSHVKQDVERELHADEMRELLQKRDGLAEIREVAEETASVFKDARDELGGVARESRRVEQARSATPAEPAAADAPAEKERRIAHHAVDEDPFAPSNLASVMPDAGNPSDPPAESGKENETDHEKPAERPGQH